MGRAAKPMTLIRRMLPKATRAALEDAFKHWHDHVAPLHFQRAAFSRWPREFADSRKRDLASYRQRNAQWIFKHKADREGRPLRTSGRFAQVFLQGGYVFSGSYRRLTVRWPGVPAYVKRPNRFSSFSVARAATAVSDHDRSTLRRVFSGGVLMHMADTTKLSGFKRSYGRAVL